MRKFAKNKGLAQKLMNQMGGMGGGMGGFPGMGGR